MTHYMKLHPKPFAMIASGKKTIELRLYDEKRRQQQVGDLIVFSETGCEQQTVTARIKALHRFDDFAALYGALPLDQCGYLPEQLKDARPEDMYAYYTKQQEQQYGVVGIEIVL